MYINEAMTDFLKPVSWQTAIIYFIKTLKIFQIIFILDILEFLIILIMTKDPINNFGVLPGP